MAASPESHDPREMTDLALRPEVAAILVGATEPPGPDERAAIDDVAGLVAAVLRRRPEIQVVVSGPISSRRSWLDGLGPDADPDAARILEAPALGARSAPDEALREILEGLVGAT